MDRVDNLLVLYFHHKKDNHLGLSHRSNIIHYIE
jgi:hypothetical protein